ncbi:MAG: hypoxanthine phosphoribosyltransferase [Candidatus Zixiibacteriota bacterium]
MSEKNAGVLEPHRIEMLFRRDEIHERVRKLGEEISRDYAEKTPVLVGALKGCFVFMADLARNISVPLEMEFISAASYREGRLQDDTIAVGPSPILPILGRDVLLVEGVVDSGRTAQAITERLAIEEPRSLETVTLLRKKGKRGMDREPKYIGFEVGDLFVVGYGLDYSQLYRNLNFIGHVPEFES